MKAVMTVHRGKHRVTVKNRETAPDRTDLGRPVLVERAELGRSLCAKE